ncbi:hypothetical protein U1Q18_012108 [Sarracenia purpurea var. burkii]
MWTRSEDCRKIIRENWERGDTASAMGGVRKKCEQGTEDTVVWHYAKDGRYYVKSGYHLEQTSKRKDEECSDPAPMKKFWKKLWTTNVPNRVKI